MFWKLAFTLAVVLLIAGRSPALSHPVMRLVLPRSWQVALSALPARRPARPGPAPSSPPPSSTRTAGPWTGRRARIVLIALFLLALAAWLATRTLISAGAVPVR